MSTEETLTFWQPRTDRQLTSTDAREIETNVLGFIEVLSEWAEQEEHSE